MQQIRLFLKENKTTILVCLAVFFVFYLKFAEEGRSRSGTLIEEDLYDSMELTSKATIKEIKKQYVKLVVDYHPDKNPDCTICEEKFSKISRAYQILSKKESKEHYDQTNGILEPITSSTTSLTRLNFDRLVTDSPRPWIIQVYSESSHSSKSFAGFWEEFAENNDFLEFGRINFDKQSDILHKLPYAIGELPLIMSIVKGQHSELATFDGDRSPNSSLKRFLRSAFGEEYTVIEVEKF